MEKNVARVQPRLILNIIALLFCFLFFLVVDWQLPISSQFEGGDP